MTTEVRQNYSGLLHKCANHGARMVSLVAVWFFAMAILTLFLPPKFVPAVMALGPERRIMANLPTNVRFMRSKSHYVVLTGERENYALYIYRAGSWLVLPALRNGCLDLAR